MIPTVQAERQCPTCKAQVPAGAAFCPSCGTAVAQAPLSPAPPLPGPPARKAPVITWKPDKVAVGCLSIVVIVAVIAGLSALFHKSSPGGPFCDHVRNLFALTQEAQNGQTSAAELVPQLETLRDEFRADALTGDDVAKESGDAFANAVEDFRLALSTGDTESATRASGELTSASAGVPPGHCSS